MSIVLSRSISKCLLVILQLGGKGGDLLLACFQLPGALLQGVQLLQLALQVGFFGKCLGDQAVGTVGADLVFQIPQLLGQVVTLTAFVAGGHQLVESAAQGLVLGHGHVRKADEACAGVHALFHAQ